jgi:hypothetical protein
MGKQDASERRETALGTRSAQVGGGTILAVVEKSDHSVGVHAVAVRRRYGQHNGWAKRGQLLTPF